MPNYLSPGVYIEEREGGTRPIEAVGTAVAAFVGFTEKAEEQRDGQITSLLNRPIAITNWTQYTDRFGGFVEGAYLPYSVYGYFLNGGSRCYVVSLKALGASADERLATPAVALLPSRSEAKAETLEIRARSGGPVGNAIKVTVKEPEDPAAETFTLIIEAPEGTETFGDVTLSKGDQNGETVVNTRSRFVTVKVLQAKGTLAERRPQAGQYALQGGKIETVALTVAAYKGEVAARTGLGGLTPVDDVTMVAVPDLMQSYQAGEMSLQDVQAVQQALYEHCEQNKYAFAVLDSPPDLSPQEMLQWRQASNYDTKYAALYYPWLETADMVKGKGSVRIPPSGHIAGVYARSDAERGVHKAPANEVIRGATGLPVQLTRGEQDALNPIGVNCLRAFPGRGIRIWGARTLSSDPAWRYVNVRRLFNMVEQ